MTLWSCKLQQQKKKWQWFFLFSTSRVLRQLLVLNPVSFALHWPCQHRAPLFIDRANRGQTFVAGTYGRSQECKTHSWFLDALLHSHFSASATSHMSSGRLSEAGVCRGVWSLAASDVIFCLIISRSGGYGRRRAPRKERKG